MITAADGTAFTGATTIYVTGDGGTQAVGSVGSGACTHEGNGFHTYVPAQAETNYAHIGFTFIGTGAIPMTLQVYPTYPQTGDTYALANGATGFAAINTDVELILADTGELQTNQGNWLTATGFATPTNITSASGVSLAADQAVNATKLGGAAVTATTSVTFPAASTVATTTGAVGSVTGAVGSVTGLTASNLDAAISSLNNLSAAQVNAEMLDVLQTDTFAELAGVPAATSSLKDKLTWVFMLARNQIEQTSTTQTVRADDTTTAVATATVSDSAGTATRGEMT